MMIRSELELPTLRILIAPRRDSGSEALFQVVLGSGEPRDVKRCSLSELGLPDTLAGENPVADSELRIPDHVMSALHQAVSELGDSPLQPPNALWLEFPSPRGCLYIMPWERLLEPLGRLVLRLPNHLIRPQVPGPTLEVAICASAPMAKMGFNPTDIVEQLVQQYQQASGREVTVHLFVDQQSYWSISHLFAGAEGRVVVHDPSEAENYAQPPRTSTVRASTELSNPWLLWIRDGMQGRPFHFVHFVSHGYMSGDEGAIAMAVSPTLNTDQAWSRFIGSVELTTLLSQVGAWGLVFTGPPHNYSEAGLRELADGIALARPGVTIMHDFSRDEDCRQLGGVLRSVLDPKPGAADVRPAITCWVHPKFVEYPDEYHDELHLNTDGSSAFIATATRGALSQNDTEAWVASAARVLETQQMRWLPDSTDEPADDAAVTALRNVANLVERHVERTYGQSE